MSFLADPIILITMLVAAIAGFRLWQILGTRPREEAPPPARFETNALPSDLELKATEVKPREIWQGVAEQGSALALTLGDIGTKDMQFEGRRFLDEAKALHEKILNAFAAGDNTGLKPLLGDKTLSAFAAEIARRKAAGEQAIFKFVGIREARLAAARLQGDLAEIDVAFVTDIVSAIKSATRQLISGDEKRIATVRELWTFGRNLARSGDTWRLIDTHEQA